MRAKMMTPLSAHAGRPAGSATAAPSGVGGLRRGVWFAVAVVMSVVWFALLDMRKLQHPDEGRYAEIAREMARHRRLGDAAPERPQVFREAAAPVLGDGGDAIAAFERARMDGAPARAIAGLLAVFVDRLRRHAARSRTRRRVRGAWCSRAWSGMSASPTSSRSIRVLSLCLRCGARRASSSRSATRRRRRERVAWMWLAWAAIAGAELTKGLIGLVIPGGASSSTRSPRATSASGAACSSCAADCSLFSSSPRPGSSLVSRAQPGVRAVLLHARALRALPHAGASAASGAWWYFVPLLLVGHPALAAARSSGRCAAAGATRRASATASRGSASASSGSASCSCSSARRARSCRRTSCRCFRRLALVARLAADDDRAAHAVAALVAACRRRVAAADRDVAGLRRAGRSASPTLRTPAEVLRAPLSRG